ncbi:chemotaxis response regulator protein-glutamate methylesterase [Uliginosibacterium paludis]|uniref:Protein-glutamate methylesterase/protein-glutamine glutaminase n=1 Tax=Uliginosibacterium paludis TaxID=1615952 RepID=A0ABV2CRI1_9RHOO
MARIRVLIVDDSAVIRQVVTQLLSADPGIEVLGAAADPLIAMERMKKEWPDVLVMDVEMPRMDGITFLRRIMAERPTPVIICSSLTEKGAQTTIEAMSAGAVSIITKPKLGVKQFLNDASADLVAAVKSAAAVNPRRLAARPVMPVPEKHSADVILPAPTRPMLKTTERVVVIGASTGGTQALEYVLTALPEVVPGIVIVQHMPEKFTEAFAQRLDGLCKVKVKEAASNDRVLPGQALIAPGGRHTLLRLSGARYYVEVTDGPLVNRHRPSVDVLFRSAAQAAGANALGIIMTGMGDDGARGMKEMATAGAATLAQDEQSCVVFGMPKEAIRHGGVQTVVSLDEIPGLIVRYGRSLG